MCRGDDDAARRALVRKAEASELLASVDARIGEVLSEQKRLENAPELAALRRSFSEAERAEREALVRPQRAELEYLGSSKDDDIFAALVRARAALDRDFLPWQVLPSSGARLPGLT